MENKVAILAIIVEDMNSVEELNAVLHDYAPYIIGRMGIPYRVRQINIISVAFDAPHDTISAVAGKIGRLKGITAKVAYAGMPDSE